MHAHWALARLCHYNYGADGAGPPFQVAGGSWKRRRHGAQPAIHHGDALGALVRRVEMSQRLHAVAVLGT